MWNRNIGVNKVSSARYDHMKGCYCVSYSELLEKYSLSFCIVFLFVSVFVWHVSRCQGWQFEVSEVRS